MYTLVKKFYEKSSVFLKYKHEYRHWHLSKQSSALHAVQAHFVS